MMKALLEPLDWDDEEGPTQQSVRPFKQARRSSRSGWLLITGDRHQQIDLPGEPPKTERDIAPDTLASGLGEEPRSSAESFVQTLSTVIDVTEIAEDEEAYEEIEDWEEIVDERSHPHSEIRPLLGSDHLTPVSAPLPLVQPLVEPLEVPDDLELDVRTTEQRLPRIDPAPFELDTAAELVRLRRWAKIGAATGLLALLVALGSLAGSLALLLPRHHNDLRGAAASLPQPTQAPPTENLPTAPETLPLVAAPVAVAQQGIEVAGAEPGINMLVDGELRGELPLTITGLSAGTHELRFEGDATRKPLTKTVEVKPGVMLDVGTIALEPATVKVQIVTLTPHASVTVTPFGGVPEQVRGPWPRTLELEPGRYTVTGSAFGLQTLMRQLDLSLERPERQVVITLEQSSDTLETPKPKKKKKKKSKRRKRNKRRKRR